MRNLTLPTRLYIGLVCLLGGVVLLLTPHYPLADPAGLLLFLVLGGLAQAIPVPLARESSVSVSAAIAIAGILLFGPVHAAWINVAAGLVHLLTVTIRGRRPWYRSAVTTATLVLSAWSAGFVYIHLGGVISQPYPLRAPGALLAAGVVYYLLNTGLIAVVMGLETRQPIWSLWKQNYGWVTVNYLAMAGLGLGLASIYQKLGVFGVLLFLIPVAMARHSFTLYMRSTEAVRRQNDELQVANHRLQVMAEVARSLSSVLERDETCAVIVQAAVEMMGWRWCTVVHRTERGRWIVEGRRGVAPELLQGSIVPAVTSSFLAELEQDRELYVVDEQHHAELLSAWRAQGLESAAVVILPLLSDAQQALILVGAAERPEPGQLQELTIFASQALNSLEKAVIHETTKNQANIDPLTKLYNHRYLQQRLQGELEQARVRGGLLGMMMIDVNDFKKFNDTYGHLVGDQVLQVIAESIEGCIRDEDAACRYGGDEFAVLLPNADRSRSLEIAGNIERAVHSSQFSAQELLSANGDTLSVSIGISTYPEIAGSRNDLLEQADQAMYQAKSLGGGVAYYVPSARIGSGTKPLRVVK